MSLSQEILRVIERRAEKRLPAPHVYELAEMMGKDPQSIRSALETLAIRGHVDRTRTAEGSAHRAFYTYDLPAKRRAAIERRIAFQGAGGSPPRQVIHRA